MGITAGFMVPHPPMIVPQVGRGGEKQVPETTAAYEKVAEEIARIAPDTIVISSPHTVMYSDYMHIAPGSGTTGSFAEFGAPEVAFEAEYDTDFVQLLCECAEKAGISAGNLGGRKRELDHGVMVPLYFILQKYAGFKLVRIGLSGLSLTEHYRLGMEVQRVAEALERNVVYVASGDLSHKLQEYGPYGFDPAGPEYDKRIMDVMGRAAFDELFDFDENFCDKAAECGHRSFVMMAGAFDRKNVEAKKLSHADVTGVGYGICTYRATGDNEDRAMMNLWQEREKKRLLTERENEDGYVRLARMSLENYIITGEPLTWSSAKDRLLAGESSEEAKNALQEELTGRQAGAFVSIHKEGRLRGCIGTIGPVCDKLADEIIVNAISASTRDPRFSPIKRDELLALEITVDVLSETEPIDSEDELDVKRYGVIVTKGGRRGLLLPNLDGVDTVEEQLAIAKKKAGLAEDEKGCKLERFEVVRHY